MILSMKIMTDADYEMKSHKKLMLQLVYHNYLSSSKSNFLDVSNTAIAIMVDNDYIFVVFNSRTIARNFVTISRRTGMYLG